MTVVIFSLDYDGNGSVLNPSSLLGRKNKAGTFEKAHSAIGHKIGCYADLANQFKAVPQIVSFASAIYQETMQSHIHSERSVELYVGSLRQSKNRDDYNASQNENGSCFEVFYEYAQQQNYKFRPLLLADVEQGDPLFPRAMYLALNHPEEKQLHCSSDRLKGKIILAQLQDMARNHPNEDIEFVYMDDDRKDIIIPHLKSMILQAYNDPTLVKTLPPNISIFMYQFNWEPLLGSALAIKTDDKLYAYIQIAMILKVTIDYENAQDLKRANTASQVSKLNPSLAHSDSSFFNKATVGGDSKVKVNPACCSLM
ncbi:MAG: hypothetical protein H0U75_04390 [Legionella sp.]|nr:hypothetical protein [Legionella sp.]